MGNLSDLRPCFRTIAAGMSALIIAVGVARFAFTAMLPEMMADFLNVQSTGILTALNYAGYLAGSFLAIFTYQMRSKVLLMRAALVLCLVSTLILGICRVAIIWQIARFVAGVGSGILMVVASALVFEKIPANAKKIAMGVYFAGAGIAILGSSIIAQMLFSANLSWQRAWLFFCGIGAVLALFSIRGLNSHDATLKKPAKMRSNLLSNALIIAYFLEGIGFVVQASFLPDIVNRIPNLEGFGRYVWFVAGACAIFGPYCATQIAHKMGTLATIVALLFLQSAGILLPVISQNFALNALSGAIYGWTMMGLTALFMSYGAQLFPSHSSAIMGKMTAAYSAGTIIAPLYCAHFFALTGTYDASLLLTALLVGIAGVILIATNFILRRAKCHLSM